MAKFNAATAVEALEFDFTKFDGPSGTIPEPSSGQVKKFYKELQKIQEEVQLRISEADASAAPPLVVDGKIVAPTEEDEIEAGKNALESFVSLSEDEADEWNDRGLQAVVDVCSEAFTKDDLDRLPYRVGRAFMKWLSDQLRPEEQTPASRR